MIQYEEEDELY